MEEKMITVSVLIKAIDNALQQLDVDGDIRHNIVEEISNHVAQKQNFICKLAFIKGKEVDVCVVLEKVVWIEADGCYTKFHMVDGNTHVLSANLSSTLSQLLAAGWDAFVRIHKSYAVNINYVKSKSGNILHVGKMALCIGRQYQKVFENYYLILKK